MHATHPRVASRTAVLGFLLLFLLYQLPEASQHQFRNDYLFLALMLLMVVAAHGVARWQGLGGLAAFGLDRHPGYLRNLGLGLLPGSRCLWRPFSVGKPLG